MGAASSLQRGSVIDNGAVLMWFLATLFMLLKAGLAQTLSLLLLIT
jgi:hypothetical protein